MGGNLCCLRAGTMPNLSPRLHKPHLLWGFWILRARLSAEQEQDWN